MEESHILPFCQGQNLLTTWKGFRPFFSLRKEAPFTEFSGAKKEKRRTTSAKGRWVLGETLTLTFSGI
ncbi:hypothetical protein MAR_ORF076 [Marseillevirus marseillevirus]|uniref:Uncharacterized protein n=1 Tax=Marseillevirus marseillevirus TaxID=694581 RepID=D2XA84_GBMV|nr:hypothetical protein MAR_ORF076 [Marseillevirus marseillevirus]ADB03861.1 hypothetical protein MAR_ORF076 [Marseillevirus marseillevirus]